MNPYEPTAFEENPKSPPRQTNAFVVFTVTGCLFASSMMFVSTILRMDLRTSIGVSIAIAMATIAYEIRWARTPKASGGKKVLLFVLLTCAVGVYSARESARAKTLQEAAKRMQRFHAERQSAGE